MTERPRVDLERSDAVLRIGPSRAILRDGRLTLDIDERTVPVPSRIQGTITVDVGTMSYAPVALDAAERHIWQPLAPRTRVTVDLASPRLRWSGDAYVDRNYGSEPLEAAFTSWEWSRGHIGDDALVVYDVLRRDQTRFCLSRRFLPDGKSEAFEAPTGIALPSTLWRIARSMRSGADQAPRVLRTLEDTPFYARSLVETTLAGRRLACIHESLSLERVANPIVRLMLPFRMPRWRHTPGLWNRR